MGGISAARGKYVIMGDADDSYDFLDIAKFVHKLREGYDLVQGCRLPSGGGTVMPGAMPFLQRPQGQRLLPCSLGAREIRYRHVEVIDADGVGHSRRSAEANCRS